MKLIFYIYISPCSLVFETESFIIFLSLEFLSCYIASIVKNKIKKISNMGCIIGKPYAL